MPGGLWAVDVMAGYNAVTGILAALYERERSGEGRKVVVSMLGSALECEVQELTTYLNTGAAPPRYSEPTAHSWEPAPYGVFRTADSWITIALAPTAVLAEVLDEERLAGFSDYEERVTSRDEIVALVKDALVRKTTREWLALLWDKGLYAGPVYRYGEVASDDHIVGTGMLVDVPHPNGGVFRTVAPAVSFAGSRGSECTGPPALGSHTDEVLRDELGLSGDELEELRQARII